MSAGTCSTFGGLLLLLALVVPPPLLAQDETPKTARAWNAQGIQLARAGESQAAVNAFSEAIKLNPNSAGTLINRAIAYIKLEEWEKAEEDSSRTIEIDPENARAYQQRAIARSESGRHDEALKDASRAARMEPDNPSIVFTRYLTCSRLGRHELGHFAGETYIGLQSWSDPWSPYLALLNNVSLRRAGFEEEARSILEESAQWLDQTKWPMPIAVYLRGDMDAKTLLEIADSQDARTIARYYIGMNRWLSGDPAAARGEFQKVREEGNPDFLQYMLAKDHLVEIANAGVKE